MVIDLDELKATWCYVVMPKMRPRDGMGRNAQNRMMAHMPDSIKSHVDGSPANTDSRSNANGQLRP